MRPNYEPIEILRKTFEANPGKSTIRVKGECSDCGAEIILSITRTSGGFGLNGGSLLKDENESCLAKCPDCHKALGRKA